MTKITTKEELKTLKAAIEPIFKVRNDGVFNKDAGEINVRICMGSSCLGSGAGKVMDAFKELIKSKGLEDGIKVVKEVQTGCHGLCEMGPIVIINPGDVLYVRVQAEDVKEIVEKHLVGGEIVDRLLYHDASTDKGIANFHDITFYNNQTRNILSKNGLIDPWDIKEYIGQGGYEALIKVLKEMTPEQVLDEIKAAGVRGRGGAGFPTATKWGFVRSAQSDTKYVVCNGDEGDPGAYMNRSVLEGNPHSVVEGMVIGAYAIGNVTQGYAYIRAEYPLAIKTIANAIEQAKEYGFLGENILGTGMNFDIEIFPGAGAFVCGEETALLESIEGKMGRPRQRPPFPANVGGGLFGMPTTINNVETWSNIPMILSKGSDWYGGFGNERATGTKTFSLVGNIVNTGLVEVPLGTSIGKIIMDIGGGCPNGKKFKGVQMGGPSGGVIPASHLNTPVDYESVSALGAIMGSGGLVVMDEDSCMVDVAKYFLEFCKDESCGKCVPCREGIPQMLDILNSIANGEAELSDIDRLEELAMTIKSAALCQLGQTAPNPVLSTLRHFRDEYEAHIVDKKCPAAVCKPLFASPCQHTCPVELDIPGYISLVKAGKFVDSYKLIKQRNPLPAVCGRVCNHPCEMKCNRAKQDEALRIRDIKRFAADYAYNEGADVTFHAKANKPGRVAIVGAGPAGLSAAWDLALEGYKVDVFEAQEVAGGMLATAIPEYRLPKAILDAEIDEIARVGVNIMVSTPVENPVALIDKGYDAVFIATGSAKGTKLGIAGEDLDGVYDALEFLAEVNLGYDVEVGDKVAVVGGGNSAIDSARVAMRMGAEEVYLIYRRAEADMTAQVEEIEDLKEEGMAMMADASNIEAAKKEGVHIMTLTNPTEIIGTDGKVSGIKCVKMELKEFDRSARRTPYAIEGSEFVIDVDTVIEAIGQQADTEFAAEAKIETGRGGTIKVTKAMATTVAGIFAGGDVTTGPSTVIESIAAGQKAAASIAKYLQKKDVYARNEGEAVAYPATLPTNEELKEKNRIGENKLPAGIRNRSFVEVTLTMSPEEAMAEAARCLRCDIED